MHLVNIPTWLNFSYVAAAALVALCSGDWRARVIGALQIVLQTASALICHYWLCWGPNDESLIPWRGPLTDSLLLAVCIAAAWRAERYWVICACSFAMLGEVTDAAALDPRFSTWAIGSAGLVWWYGLATSVLVGAWPSAWARVSAAVRRRR